MVGISHFGYFCGVRYEGNFSVWVDRVDAATRWCNTSAACSGFTTKANPNHSKSITKQCLDIDNSAVYTVYFKAMLGGNADPLWSSWRKINHVCGTHLHLPQAPLPAVRYPRSTTLRRKRLLHAARLLRTVQLDGYAG